MTVKWSPSTLHQLGAGPRGGRGGDVRLGLTDRDDVVGAAVHAPDRHVERELLLGIGGRVVGPGRVAEQRLDRSPAQACVVRRLQVEDAGLGDHGGDVDPTRPTLEPAPRGSPRREVATGRVAERDHRRQVEVGQVGQGVDPGRDVVESRRHPAAVAHPAVFEVPSDPAPVGERGGQRLPERAVVRRLPEPAVDDHDHATRGPVGQEQLGDLAGVLAVGDQPARAAHERLGRLVGIRRAGAQQRAERAEAGQRQEAPSVHVSITPWRRAGSRTRPRAALPAVC